MSSETESGLLAFLRQTPSSSRTPADYAAAMTDLSAAPLPSSGHLASRLPQAVVGLAIFTIVLGVGRHLVDAISVLMPVAGSLSERLQAVPMSAWGFAALHLVGALGSLVVGYVVISWAYPGHSLLQMARTVPGNPAAALQAGAHLLAATVIATVSWGGCDAASLLVSAVFCALGWLALIALSAGHRLITRYRDHEEIADGNVAAALASAGLHLAVAVVVARAIQGTFDGWHDSLLAFGLALVWALALYPLRQVVLARLLLGITPRELDDRIMVHHDRGLGAVEGLCYVLTALSLAAGA